MIPNNKRNQTFHVSIWHVAGVVITFIGLVWSIGWGVYTKFGPEAPLGNNAGILAASGSNQQGDGLSNGTPTHAAAKSIIIPIAPTAQLNSGGCYSTSCDGLDPSKNGCVPDEYLVSATDIYINQVKVAKAEFYISQVCAAGWVNIETPQGTTGTLSAQINNGAYQQKYCIPLCPVQRNGLPDRQNVHSLMIHTNQNYNIWGRGCYFPQSAIIGTCFPQADAGEYGFQGYWP